MDRQTALAQLRNILADLYPDAESARRVADDAGLDARRIAFSNQAQNNWHAILQAALRQDKVEPLCAAVCHEYADHAALHSACDQLRAAHPSRGTLTQRAAAGGRPWVLALTGLLLLAALGWIALRLIPVPSGPPALATTTPTPPAATPLPTIATTPANEATNPAPAQHCPPDRVCVLVARFAPVENDAATQFTNKIVQELRLILDATATERFAVELAAPVTDPEAARRLAREQGALLIVWGQVFTALASDVRINVHFQVTDLLGVGETQSTRPYRVQPLFYDDIAGYCTDCLYLEAAQRTNVVAATVAGLVHYVQNRPRQARHDFMTALYCAGDLDEATASGETIHILQPACTPPATPLHWNAGLLYYYVGKSFYLEGNYRAAQTYLQEAAARNPADPAAWIALGAVLQDWLADPKATVAKDALAQAEAKSTQLLGEVEAATSPVVYFDRAFTHELAGELAAAQADYQAAAAGFAASGYSAYVASLGLARVQRLAGDSEAAQSTLTQTVVLAPDQPWAFLEFAQLAAETRPESEAWLQQAAALASDEAAVDIVRARLCKQWQDDHCAEDAYAQALKKRPESGLLYLEVGDFYLAQDLAQAERYYTTAAQDLRPDDPSAHQRLAYVLSQRQAFAEAIQHLQRVIELVYSDAEAAIYHCDIAHLQKTSGLAAAAKASYQRCADLTADDDLRQQAEQWLQEMPR